MMGESQDRTAVLESQVQELQIEVRRLELENSGLRSALRDVGTRVTDSP